MRTIQFSGRLRLGAWCGSLALALSMSACGGSGGGGSVAVPVNGGGTPSAQGTAGTAVTGGGGAGAPSGTGTSTPTLRDQIAALEQSGAYPKLDRSTDIAGPDANNNGVRDDIEAWINTQPLSDSQKRALLQKARSLQRTLLVTPDDQTVLQSVDDGLAASSHCGALQFAEYADFSKLAGKVEAMTANTRQRAERYMQYNKARSGSSTTSPNGNTCEP